MKLGLPPRLVFLHIPKTAGTALHQLLAGRFSPDSLCPERLRFLDRVPDAEIGKYQLYSGHYYFDQLARIPVPRQIITILRDPRSRLLSLYYFFRAHRWEHVEQCERAGVDSPRLAKELDLLTYLRRPDYLVRLYANNAITRHLIGLKYIGSDGQLTVSEDDAFALAVQNLKSLSAFGVIEHYPQCRQRLSAIVGFDLPEEMEKVNDFENFGQNPALEPVERLHNFDAETEEEIQANIRIDCRLYAWAVDQLGN